MTEIDELRWTDLHRGIDMKRNEIDELSWTYLLLVLVSAFTLVGLNWLPPVQVICCLLKKILWGLIEGRVPSPTRKNALFAADFPQTNWQSYPRPPVAGTDTSWFYQIWIQSFPSPRLIALPRQMNHYLPIAGGGDNWIHIFPNGISGMWNAISLVQDLNLFRRIHFLWR